MIEEFAGYSGHVKHRHEEKQRENEKQDGEDAVFGFGFEFVSRSSVFREFLLSVFIFCHRDILA